MTRFGPSRFRAASSRISVSRILISGALLAAPLVGASGCSFSGGTGPTVTSIKGEPVTLDIFSARGFLGGSDYERYYLNDGLLWRECGSVSKGKKDAAKDSRPTLEGDSVLKIDPQLSLEERRVERLTSKQVDTLSEQVAAFLSSSASSTDYPAPGSVFSLTDPGVFELLVHVGSSQQRVITSVDAIADQSTPGLEAVHALFATVRGVGPEICNSRTFYGIERGSVKKPDADDAADNEKHE